MDRLTRGLSYKDLYSRWTPEQESEALHEDPNWHGYLVSPTAAGLNEFEIALRV